MSGIPPAVLQQLQQQAAAAAAQAAGAAAPQPAAPAPAPGQAPAPGASPFPQLPGAARGAPDAGARGGPLAPLRSHPRYAQLRMVVQQSPQMLNQVLSAIAQTNPDLITLIAEHQEEFVRDLQDTSGQMVMPPAQATQLPAQQSGGHSAPPAGGMLQPQMDPIAAMLAAAQAAQGSQAGGGAPAMPAPMGGAAPGMPPPAGAPAAAPAAPPQVPLTPAEQEAIARLQALGFERMAAVEAFLACDRNEEVAANYLFESAED